MRTLYRLIGIAVLLLVTFRLLIMGWPASHRQPQKIWTPEQRQPSATPSDWIDPDAQDSSLWSREEAFKRDIPKYVLEYAPLIHLYPEEPYWIADPAEFLKHVRPYRNGQLLPDSVSLTNLARLNHGQEFKTVFLCSDDDVDDKPPWMLSSWNIPTEYPLTNTPSEPMSISRSSATEKAKTEGWLSTAPISFSESPPTEFKPTDYSELFKNPASKTSPGFSGAPGVLITVAKENGVLDAFWYIFNCFNLGNKFAGVRVGNHVGDWEHVMIRFQHGQPKALFTSRHAFGDSVYAWDTLQKSGQRPVVYSARGSHAMYVTAGVQPYGPFGGGTLAVVSDTTGAGPIWDPALVPGLKAFTYDATNDTIRASNLSPRAATSWLDFRGCWGDSPTSWTDPVRFRYGTEHRYADGPTGPKFKNLGRKFPCESMKGSCNIRTSLTP